MTADGRVPFRVRAGITGHKRITRDPREPIYRALERIEATLTGSTDAGSCVTAVRFAVVSQLAEGADRLAVQPVFAHANARGAAARLEVILPMQRAQYVREQEFTAASREEFERMLNQATFRLEPPSTDAAADAEDYAAAGKQLIERCDVLIALWDGRPALGRGGSAYTLLNAAAQGKPCVWIPSDGQGEPRDNLDPGANRAFFEDVKRRCELEPDYSPAPDALDGWSLQSLLRSFVATEDFNREPRQTTGGAGSRSRRAAAAFRQVIGARFAARFDHDRARAIEDAVKSGTAAALAAPAARANLLAEHYQRWFKRLSYAVLLFAALAAVMLAIGVGLDSESGLWPALECVCLALALVVFVATREATLHRRWLSYRLLAEHLRTAGFLARAAIDVRDYARARASWEVTQSQDWLMRAFEEVWDSVSHKRAITAAETEELKRLVADVWIQGQIDYHDHARSQHRALLRRLTLTLRLVIGLTLVFAALDAILAVVDASGALLGLSRALTIALPVLGGSLGAALTINQHHALAERSALMQSDLRCVQQDVQTARDPRALQAATIAAIRLIAPETGDWFGALWFHDVEYP